MDFLFKQVIINSKKYGKVKAWIVRKSMYGNGYLVFTNKGKKALTGFITESGKEIIPLAEMQLTGMLIANKGRDICFEFQYPDSEILEYYHVKTLDNCKTKLAFKTDRHAEIPAFICTLENTEDYWAIQIGTQEPQYAIYDYKKAKQITTFFDEVCYQYEGGDPSHCPGRHDARQLASRLTAPAATEKRDSAGTYRAPASPTPGKTPPAPPETPRAVPVPEFPAASPPTPPAAARPPLRSSSSFSPSNLLPIAICSVCPSGLSRTGILPFPVSDMFLPF